MTLMEKVFNRIDAVYTRHHRKPIGIVVDYNTYKDLMSLSELRVHFRPDYEQMSPTDGETFMGLDVSISKKRNTLVVY